MSKIHGENTGPEIKIRKMLFARDIRGYRIHFNIPGKPDLVFTKKKIAIFIDGCFWHKCPVCFQEPETRKEFWMKKIQSNVDRDKKVNAQLTDEGWTILRFWEHDVRKNPDAIVKRIAEIIEESNEN